MKGSSRWRFAFRSAVALAVLLSFSVLTDAARERWAVSVFQAGIFGLALLWAIRMIVRPYPLRGSILLIPLGGTILWGLLQLCANHTVYPLETRKAILGWSTNFLLFFLSLQVLAFFEIRQAFRKGLLAFGLAVSVISVIQFFTSNGKIFWVFPAQYAGRAMGPYVNPDHYASFVALVLPLALYTIVTEQKNAVAYAAMAGAMIASVIAGASRAGSILVTSEIVLLLFPLAVGPLTARRTLLAKGAGVVFFTTVFTAAVGCEVLWVKFRDPNPFRGRREMLQSSLSMIRDRPWTGFGLGTWPVAYPAYALFDIGAFANHAHNDWAEWTAEGGILFLAMLLTVLVWSIDRSIRSPWGAGVVAVFLHSLVDFPLQKPSIAALVFVMLATLAASTDDPPGGSA